jgi:hypothetical protein
VISHVQGFGQKAWQERRAAPAYHRPEMAFEFLFKARHKSMNAGGERHSTRSRNISTAACQSRQSPIDSDREPHQHRSGGAIRRARAQTDMMGSLRERKSCPPAKRIVFSRLSSVDAMK